MNGETLGFPALVSLLAALNCADDPKLAAEGSGDLTNAPAPRMAPNTALLEDCGDGTPAPGGTPIQRRPYLQSVAARSARILFSSRVTSDLFVEITLPGGAHVQSVPARLDRRARPVNGASLREAKLFALTPDTTYCYEILGATRRAGFRTAPDETTSNAVRFAVFGDSGSGSVYQRSVAAQIETVPYDFVLHAGDIAYEDGTRVQLENHFFGVYSTLTRSFGVFPVIGNHDRATENGAPVREAFRLPDGQDPPPDAYFYSFDWGPAHFVALDTNRIDAAQVDWLENDLTRNHLPWVIVFGHEPPFSSGDHGPNRAFRSTFVPVLEKHRVQLVLSGHEHDYERTLPMNGVTYVVTGGGGRGTRAVSRSSFTAYSEDVLHFVFVEIQGKTLLLHAIDGVGREFDSAKVERG